MANNIRGGVGHSHTVYASAARTATPDTEELQLPRGTKFITAVIDVTAITATPSVTLKIEGVDRASGQVWTLIADAAVTTVTSSVISVGPGLPVTANVSANAAIPPVVRFTVTHGDTDEATYSVGAHFS